MLLTVFFLEIMNRTIYTTSQLNVDGQEFLVKSISYNRDLPKQTIEKFGSKDFLLVQNEPNICTLDFTFYPQSGKNLGSFFQNLKTQTESHEPTRSSVSSNMGSLQNALLTSLRGEASVGSLPTMSAKFIGASGASLSSLATPSEEAISSIPTTQNISVGGGCSQKVSFSWDIPVINIQSYTGSLTQPIDFFGDLPGKFAINIDQISGSGGVSGVTFGDFNLSFSGHEIISSGIGMAVGDLFATVSLGIEGPPSKVTFS